jgi:glucose-6-phosphate dehydrogenase assembly protein OpcA
MVLVVRLLMPLLVKGRWWLATRAPEGSIQ